MEVLEIGRLKEKVEGKLSKQVIVDADACPKPSREIITVLVQKYPWEMVTVASFNHQISGMQRHIVVGNEPQAADLAVMQLAGHGDVVVTQDWGLAALVMGKGAKAISPRGIIYNEENMDFLLEERHLKAKFRRHGGRTKGPAAWSKEDSIRFEKNLERLLQQDSQQAKTEDEQNRV